MKTITKLTVSVSKLGFAAAITTILASCTNHVRPTALEIDKAMAELTGQDGRACVRTSDISGYAVDDGVIKIPARRNYYVATTLYSCPHLDFGALALFDSRGFETCGGRSAVVTRDTRCPIKSIYEFENRKEAFAAIDAMNEKLAEQLAAEKAKSKSDT